MIFSKTPLRMSFVGGGSDIASYYREEGGAVLSTAIDRYIYIAVHGKFDGRIRLSYSRTEEVDLPEEIEHPLVREALHMTGVGGGIEIGSFADIPSKGTGLGSSSSFTVGLLHALHAYQSRYVSKLDLASQACEIEIDRCGEPIGKQDQFAAAYGGLNLIEFHRDDSVAVSPVICSNEVLRDFERQIIVFFTGRTRSASEILARQTVALSKGNPRLLMRRMVELAYKMKDSLQSGSTADLGPLLDENWRLKSQLVNGISDSAIDLWYQKAIGAGATGGKLMGAGNGGFMMFLAPPGRHDAIADALSDLQRHVFRFDTNGSQIVFYQNDGIKNYG